MCAEDYAIAYSKWQNYFCETGVRTVFNKSQFFSNNPLWDLFGRTISVRQVWEQSWMKAHATKVRVSNNLNYKHGWFTDEVWEWCLRTLPWVNYGAEFTSRLIVWKFGVDREAYATLSFMHTSSMACYYCTKNHFILKINCGDTMVWMVSFSNMMVEVVSFSNTVTILLAAVWLPWYTSYVG